MAIKTNVKDLTPRREALKEEISLLSGGFVNKKLFPKGKITIYPWDSEVDDWIVKRARQSNQHLFMHDLLGQIADLKGNPIPNFYLGDMYTCILVSRALKNKGSLSYISKCPVCQTETTESINVPDDLEPLGKKSDTWKGFDTIQLPECKDKVSIRPLKIEDEIAVNIRVESSDNKHSSRKWGIALQIVTVGGEEPTNLAEVIEWFDAIPSADVDYLEEASDQLSPHLNQVIKHKCDKPNCGEVFDHRISFDQQFFRSGSDRLSGDSLAQDMADGVRGEGV